MTAKEMFEKLGYECYQIEGYILYEEPTRDLGGLSAYIKFYLEDKKWLTNIVGIYTHKELLQAINKQIEELGWK